MGDPSEPGIDPVNVDKGDIDVDHSLRDISDQTKDTIGRFLSRATQVNKFKVDQQRRDSSITTDKGVPAPVAETVNSEKFAPRKEIKNPTDASKQQRLGDRYFDSVRDPLNDLQISKGRAYPQLPDGHSALKDVVGGKPGKLGPVQGYVSTVLSNNRFSDAARSVNVNVRDPGEFNPKLRHPKYGDVSLHRLAQVGVSLSLRASQELSAANASNDPSSGGQEAKALLPGLNQLGTSRINPRILEARDVLDDLTKNEVPDGNIVSITRGGSWGSLNNVDDPFSGFTSLGMIALSAALTAATVVVFEGLGFVMSLIKGGNATGAAKNIDGRYVLGRYTVTEGANPNAFPPTSFPPDIGAMLGIRPTIHPFSKALQTGVAAFFGIDTSNGILGQLTSGLTSSTENPGFNSIVARSIIRSSVTVVDSFKTAFRSSNLTSGVKNVLKIVESIRGSKLIGAMNVFAVLGDQLLVDELKDETLGVEDGARPEEPVKKSKIDKLDDRAGAVAKNRLKNSLKLAWSSNRAPASYLVPDTLLSLTALGGKFGGFQTGIGTQDKASRTFFRVMKLADILSVGPRIPYDGADDEVTVKNVERALEGEYMPFYLHDLRTNEIVSFHSFITQLTDDYTANWEDSEGFGRIDPVRIYKNTRRKIQLGFYVVSTSEEDHRDMWLKVNKLVTMVYPQYTKGRVLSDEEGQNQFVQPFSQLVGASPLVRIRLGDLLRSNYSRFALARLFGADLNEMKLDGQELKFQDGISGLESFRKIILDDVRNPSGKKFSLNANNLSQETQKGQVSISLPSPIGGSGAGDKPKFAASFSVFPGDLPFFLFQVKSDNNDGTVNLVPELLSRADIVELYGFSTPAASDKLAYLESEYSNSDKPVKKVVGGVYVAPKNLLRPSPKSVTRALHESFPEGAAGMDKLSSFLSPDNNALIKSFQSAGGQGLAATIDSLNFDWHENVLWETKPGQRAPMFCRVSMNLTPIHDISPGLDCNGHTRAPVYPVGYHFPAVDQAKSSK